MMVHGIELIAAIILFACVCVGVKRGFVKTIYGLIRFALSVIVAIILTPIIAVYMPASIVGRNGIAFLIAFVIACILFGILNYALGIVDHIPGLNQLNKLAGGVAGILTGLVLIWVCMMLLAAFTKVPWCVEIMKEIRKSDILMYIYSSNPIPKIWSQWRFPKI